jgi:hypothetical protein
VRAPAHARTTELVDEIEPSTYGLRKRIALGLKAALRAANDPLSA